ncbi:hypothetical protein [Alcanivorax xiamenensis]|uniref:hypothetical protein n=1 Tax=Alcanivorax xiamenensis TaxID=1177156 RepID=UPI001F48194B|nr:hypothetical protein [Alcanivorax xiamenensis]
MNTLSAYLIVVAVWATTPLGIKWSGEAMPPWAAAGSRMALAALLGLLWLACDVGRWPVTPPPCLVFSVPWDAAM